MIDGAIGRQYLKSYFEKTDKLFEGFFENKIAEAALISKIPAELLRRFLETARLGKKIRGALVLLGYELAGGTDKAAILDTSLFIELFHAGILVHDDVMDSDELRRGLPSLHKQFERVGEAIKIKGSALHYGEAMAVSVGDAAFYLSWEKLLQGNFPGERLLTAGRIYADYVLRVVHGQVLDITDMGLLELTEEDVLKVLRLKSAEYTGVLPLKVGAVLGGLGENDPKMKALEEYGLAFGWTFQIQDDVLGLYGKTEYSGKPVGSDLREGKNTLFMLHLAKHGTESDKAFQRQVLGNRNVTEAEVQTMREILKKSGSYDYVIRLGYQHLAAGKKCISKITQDSGLQNILESLIVYMMERTK